MFMQEVRDYGEFLGLNVSEDEEFMWIAEEALCAPLPAGWTEHFRYLQPTLFHNLPIFIANACSQEYGAVYYFNSHTQESVWRK